MSLCASAIIMAMSFGIPCPAIAMVHLNYIFATATRLSIWPRGRYMPHRKDMTSVIGILGLQMPASGK